MPALQSDHECLVHLFCSASRQHRASDVLLPCLHCPLGATTQRVRSTLAPLVRNQAALSVPALAYPFASVHRSCRSSSCRAAAIFASLPLNFACWTTTRLLSRFEAQFLSQETLQSAKQMMRAHFHRGSSSSTCGLIGCHNRSLCRACSVALRALAQTRMIHLMCASVPYRDSARLWLGDARRSVRVHEHARSRPASVLRRRE